MDSKEMSRVDLRSSFLDGSHSKRICRKGCLIGTRFASPDQTLGTAATAAGFTMKYMEDMEAASGSLIEKPMQDLPQNAQEAQG